MMVTLGIYVRRGQRTLRRWLADHRLHAWLQCAGWLGAGFALAAGSLAGRPQPLALGLLMAVSGWSAVLVSMGAMAGYMLLWGAAGVQGVVWIMAGTVAAVALGGREFLRETPLLMPALSALVVAALGVAFQLWQGDTTPTPLYLLRIALAALSTALFAAAFQRRDPVLDWLVGFVAVLALAQIAPIPWVNLGCLAASIIACTGAFPAAALAGMALDLAQITTVPMTAVLAGVYLLRLLPWRRGKLYYLAPGAVFLLVMSVNGVWDIHPVVPLALGGMVAVFLPGNPGLAHRRGETGAAQVRLEMASAVLSQTGELLDLVEEGPVDEAALVARAAERACGSCPCRKSCQEEPANLSPEVLHKPLGNGSDLPRGCRKTGRLLQELRRSQEQLRTIRADRDRRQEYRRAVVQQYGFLADYLRSLSDSLAQRKDPPRQWYQPEVAVCSASRERSNGDRCLWFAGVECRYYILICDGMGTGPEAAAEGRRTGEMLRKLLSAGYPPEHALGTVNSLCALRGRAGIVTIDLAELRLDTGKAVLYKWGGAPSYVLSRGETVKIGTATPPPGLSVTESREAVEGLSLRRGETLVMLSDGAGGEEALRLAWERAGQPVGELAARILESSREDASDDATVAVVRLSHIPLT